MAGHRQRKGVYVLPVPWAARRVLRRRQLQRQRDDHQYDGRDGCERVRDRIMVLHVRRQHRFHGVDLAVDRLVGQRELRRHQQRPSLSAPPRTTPPPRSTRSVSSGGSAIPNPAANQTLTIQGIEVRLSDVYVSSTCNNLDLQVQLSWDGGSHWTTTVGTYSSLGQLGTNTSNGDYTFGATRRSSPSGTARTALGSATTSRQQLQGPADGGQGHLRHDADGERGPA